MNYLANPQTWIVVLATLIVVGLCIDAHYLILSGCRKYLALLPFQRRRRVMVLIFIILFAHTLEIWLFACTYYALVVWAEIGSLSGLDSEQLPEYVYYSAMVYTTVGFGDVLPSGPIRFLSGVEALTGLVMITWSASYTFIEMERDWRI